MIRVLVADDHAVVRQGLRQILAGTSDMRVTGEAATGPEALALAGGGGFDVLVLDLNLPGRSGFDILKALRAEKSQLPVLILSLHAEAQFAVRLLKAGAAGYLGKAAAPAELIKAIRKVFASGRYVSPALAERLANELGADSARPLHDNLSDREFQVMRLLAAGRTVKEIAANLALSVKTVSTYRTRILDKLSLHTNARLIHYAIQHQLVE